MKTFVAISIGGACILLGGAASAAPTVKTFNFLARNLTNSSSPGSPSPFSDFAASISVTYDPSIGYYGVGLVNGSTAPVRQPYLSQFFGNICLSSDTDCSLSSSNGSFVLHLSVDSQNNFSYDYFEYTYSPNGAYTYLFSDDVEDASAVPEPASWAMMMLGFGGVGYAIRRKNKGVARIKFA